MREIRESNQSLAIIVMLLQCCACAMSARADTAAFPTTAPSSAPPTTQNALALPTEAEGFDPAQYAFDGLFGARRRLYDRGIQFEPNLILDYSKDLMGGLNTRDGSVRERFNFPLEIDTEKLFGLHGGQFAVV